MATKVYTVKAPDGSIIKVRGPEGAAPEEVIAQAKRLTSSAQPTPQNAPVAAAEGGAGATPPPPTPEAPAQNPNAAPDPTEAWKGNWAAEEMPGWKQFLAGYGGVAPGLAIGAKQLLGIGDEEQNRQDAIENKRAADKLSETGAGFAGNLAGNIAAAAPVAGGIALTAPASLPALTAAGAGEGALMGALAPTEKEGERLQNVLWGGGLGGAMPVGGAAVRKLVGEVDPVLKRAADVLKRYDIKTSQIKQAPGALSKTSEGLISAVPFINEAVDAGNMAKRGKAGDALFNMLDMGAPESSEQLGRQADRLGQQIGDLTKGKRVDISGLTNDLNAAYSKYMNLTPSQRNPAILRRFNDLSDLEQQIGNLPGGTLRGEAYQTIRSDLGEELATAKGQHRRALKAMQKALDNKFADSVDIDTLAQLNAKKAQFRVANALRGVDFKDGQLDLSQARKAVERTARRGDVMPEARELLNAVEDVIPKARARNASTRSVVGGTALATLLADKILPAALMGAPVYGALRTGLPQKAVANKHVRLATSRLLRGYTQSALSDED